LKNGTELVQLLEKQKSTGLAYFEDPPEGAIVFTTIEVLKSQEKGTLI
jgi:hypothetical protein